ncbi:MAG TPA: methyltransferase domain-containing protein [Burkholderiales bacterium]|nr:methyltransferase domain-containing protein [Burkholderiales bacterium]
MGWLMNRHNAKMNAFAVEQLELGRPDRVLEIGFGGGVALRSLVGCASFIGGVDLSREMVEWARARYSAAVIAGRADFREGSVEAIPFDAASFGKALTVNTVYFWRSLDAGFAEIRRVLAPGGRVVIGFLPKEWMDRLGHPPDIFTPRTPEEIVAALTASGFKHAHIERPDPTTRWNVAVATR